MIRTYVASGALVGGGGKAKKQTKTAHAKREEDMTERDYSDLAARHASANTARMARGARPVASSAEDAAVTLLFSSFVRFSWWRPLGCISAS